MNVSLDFDDTSTRDLACWLEVAKVLQKFGHTVYMVTMRYTHERHPDMKPFEEIMQVVYTGRMAKQAFMYGLGIRIDVWMDDMPKWVLIDAPA